jgi:DtxR family transcriptional regulator, Mn-dependent transcriptional regulator
LASEGIEEYLEAIGRLDERGERVTTSALAKARKVAPPSATQMLARLAELEMVTYRSRGEVVLTEKGRAMARSVMRRHRLWERFLHDVLGIRWDRVHGEACRLEHATSPDIERELARLVGDGTTCPHGNAIPGADGTLATSLAVPLLHLSPDQPAEIVRIPDEDPVLLREIDGAGLRPGAVLLSSVRLAGGGVALRLEEGDRSLSEPAAGAIEVLPLSLSPRADSVPVSALLPGETAIVRSLAAGKILVARCLALGFTPGAEVKMLRNPGSGPVIVCVRDTRVALGRGEAQKILVTRRAEPDGRSPQP